MTGAVKDMQRKHFLQIYVLIGCLLVGCTSPQPMRSGEDVLNYALMTEYMRVRSDGRNLGKSIAEYWFLQTRKNGVYCIFSGYDGSQLYFEKLGESSEGQSIYTVWFPFSQQSYQFPADMCLEYNALMIKCAVDLAKKGDFETGYMICRQIRKLCPDLENLFYWEDIETIFTNQNSKFLSPYTLKNITYTPLSHSFEELQEKLEKEWRK